MTATEWARLYGHKDVEAFIAYVTQPRPAEQPEHIDWDEWKAAA